MAPKPKEPFGLITVDKHNLEQEWVDQPGAMHYCLIQWAEALQDRKEYDANTERVMAVEGDLARIVVGEKGTETAIKRLVLASKPYQAAQKESAQAAHVVHLMEAERTALEHKKAALENLTKLRLADWYSEPKQPRNYDKDNADQRAGLTPRKRPSRV